MSVGHDSNPAGRLWGILARTAEQAKQAPNTSLRDSWTAYLDLSERDDVHFISAVAEVLRLPDQVTSAVERLVNPVPPAEVLLEPLSSIRSGLAFAPTPGATVHNMMNVIDDGQLSMLRTCSFILAAAEPEPVMTASSREEVRSHAVQLVETLLADTELPRDLRRRILASAQSIIAALDLYVVAGAEAALAEWDRLVGALVRDPGAVAKHHTNPAIIQLRKLGGSLLVALSLYTGPAAIMDANNTYLELIAPAEVAQTDDTIIAPEPPATPGGEQLPLP